MCGVWIRWMGCKRERAGYECEEGGVRFCWDGCSLFFLAVIYIIAWRSFIGNGGRSVFGIPDDGLWMREL